VKIFSFLSYPILAGICKSTFYTALAWSFVALRDRQFEILSWNEACMVKTGNEEVHHSNDIKKIEKRK